MGTGVDVGDGMDVGARIAAAVDISSAVKVGVGTSAGSVTGVAADRSTVFVPLAGGASDVARTLVATLTAVSAVGPVVGVEIAVGVGWPAVQARAARAIMTRNARATGFIYQLLVPAQSQQAVSDDFAIRLCRTIPANSLVQPQINRSQLCGELLPFGPLLDLPRDEITALRTGQASPVRVGF